MTTAQPSPKIRIGMLYGGRSAEHEISLQSAAAIFRHLDHTRFDILPIGIDKQGRWWLNDVRSLPQTGPLPVQTARALPLPTLAQPAASLSTVSLPTASLPAASRSTVSASTAKLSAAGHSPDGPLCDVLFPMLHGSFGENGAMQGLLEMLDIPYVGAGVLGSALGMDKVFAKRLVAAAGIPVGPYLDFNVGIWQRAPAETAQRIETQLGFPVFVKPVNTGSSIGISKVKTPDALADAVEHAFQYDTRLLVERALTAREIEIAVLEHPEYGRPPKVSVAGEIVPRHEFYSYEAKYLDAEGAALLIPAALSPPQLTQLQQLAGAVFTALHCEGMTRIDWFLEEKTGQFYFNEINTLPGFTSISMYPKLWEASGLPYSQLLSCLIELALSRHGRRKCLKRDRV